MALFFRIWTAVVAVALCVLALFVGLATLQFGSINASLVGERLQVLAERTASPFAAAVRIGLPLSMVRNAPGLLERARQTDDVIEAIHVYDQRGRIVFSTLKHGPEALAALIGSDTRSAAERLWFREGNGHFFSGAAIRTPNGTPAGGVVIVYPDTAAGTQVRAMLAELSMAALGVLLLVAAVGAVLLRAGLAQPIRRFEEVDRAVEAFERDAWRSAAGGDGEAGAADPTGLVGRLRTAELRYRETGHALHALKGDEA